MATFYDGVRVSPREAMTLQACDGVPRAWLEANAPRTLARYDAIIAAVRRVQEWKCA